MRQTSICWTVKPFLKDIKKSIENWGLLLFLFERVSTERGLTV